MDDIREDSRATSKPQPGVSTHLRGEHIQLWVFMEGTRKISQFNLGYIAAIKCILSHRCIYYRT